VLTLVPIRFPMVQPGNKLADLVASGLRKGKLRLVRGDIVAVASKVVSTCEKRLVRLGDVSITPLGRRLAAKWGLDEKLASLVASQADQVLGGVKGFLLTAKNGYLVPNAGVDLKNSPPGTAMLWPINPDRSARELRADLERRYRTKVGVEIVDSQVTPLRLGTVGLAIGVSGFVPVVDRRGTRDLYGRRIRVTQANLGDDIASACHLLMGESSEQIGAVLIRGVSVALSVTANGQCARLSLRKCLIGNNLADTLR